MNDRLAMPNSKDVNRNGSKCGLPSCNKQILHLERHLLNAHNLTYGAYLERMIKTGPASAPTASSPDSFATTNSVRSSSFGTSSATESLGSKSPNTSQSDNVIVLIPDTPEWEYNNK